MQIVALLIAAIAGVSMAIQGSLNTGLGKVIGLLEATLIVHLTGTIFVLVLLLVGLSEGKWQMLGKAPWYTYLGGLIGVGIIYGVVVSIGKVGVAAATTAIIIGQVSMAAVVDHLGLFGLEPIPFNIWKGVGIVFMASAAWMLLHK